MEVSSPEGSTCGPFHFETAPHHTTGEFLGSQDHSDGGNPAANPGGLARGHSFSEIGYLFSLPLPFVLLSGHGQPPTAGKQGGITPGSPYSEEGNLADSVNLVLCFSFTVFFSCLQ